MHGVRVLINPIYILRCHFTNVSTLLPLLRGKSSQAMRQHGYINKLALLLNEISLLRFMSTEEKRMRWNRTAMEAFHLSQREHDVYPVPAEWTENDAGTCRTVERVG